MKEIQTLLQAYREATTRGRQQVLALVTEVKGSSYRRPGARMLIAGDGTYQGGISGGCLEGDALKKAMLAAAENRVLTATYNTALEGDTGIGATLGCKGVITVAFIPLDFNNPFNPLARLTAACQERQEQVLITIIKAPVPELAGHAHFPQPDSWPEKLLEIKNVLQEETTRVLESRQSALRETGNWQLFIEYLPPPVRLIVAGGNYDILPLLRLAGELAWDTVLLANPRRLPPEWRQLAGRVVGTLDEVEVDDYTALVIMNHDYPKDLAVLQAVRHKPLPYIGLLGPASRRDDLLQDAGIGAMPGLYAPVGLDIGARQPEEIALAMVAEILAVLRQRPGGHLKNRQAPINKEAALPAT